MVDHIVALKDIVGDEHVLTEAADMVAYETPWRGDQGKAAFVVKPKDTSEVSQVISYLSASQIPFIAQSGNTGLVGASTPDNGGKQAVLSLKRLNQIQEINKENRSAHVGAGVTLSALNEAAAKHGLFFPIDLGSDPCIGGMASTNTGGSRLLKYGDVRSNLLGLSAVLRDGTLLDMMSSLYKNNTGLDLKQLFIGTGGQNGVISECVVKLSPLPRQSATALIIPSENKAVPRLLIELEKRFGDELSAFEGMSKNSIEAAFSHNGSSIKNGFHDDVPDYVCLVELNRTWPPRDNEQSLDDVLQMGLADIMEQDESLLTDALFGNPEEHWALRHAISEGVQKSGKLISFDISFDRGVAMKFREFILDALPQHFSDITICDFGHIGDGAMHFNLVVSSGDSRLQDPDFIPGVREWVFERVIQDFQGSYSAEHGIGPSNQAAYEKYTPDDVKAITERIKAVCASSGC